jgi:hypothetical protein
LDTKTIITLLKNDDVQWDVTDFSFSGQEVHIHLNYNPYSHFVVATMKASCNTAAYALVYKVNESGLAIDTIEGVKGVRVGP